MAFNDRLFQAIASRFPTERIDENLVGALWRVLFYALQPSQPFVMRTRHYRLWAWPKKGTLTRTVIRRGYWEATLTALFTPHLKPGGFVIDAGANFGHFGLVAAQMVGPAGAVCAFEPHGPSFALLASNIELNQFSAMKAERAALSDVNGETSIVADSANPGGHSLSGDNVTAAAEVATVPVRTLDAYLAEAYPDRKVDVIKIDVQGYEAHLIAGAMSTLRRDLPVVFCEITPAMLHNVGRSEQEILSVFEKLGYSAVIAWDSANLIEARSFAEIAEACRQTGGHIDLVLTPPT